MEGYRMSPTEKNSQLLSSLRFEMRSREGVHELEVRHCPHAGLGPDNSIVGKDVVRVRLLPDHQNKDSYDDFRKFFWKKVKEIGISQYSVALEIDEKEYPIWDPPV